MAEEELERFRREWQNEVTARRGGAAPAQLGSNSSRPYAARRLSSRIENASKPRKHSISKGSEEDFPDLDAPDSEDLHTQEKLEPRTALEHYEKAVERETQGNLGDSLLHYRKAFKLDDRVDVQYKNKHFPPSSFAAPPKPPDVNPSNASSTVPGTAHHSLQVPPSAGPSTSTGSELLASFAGSAILGAEPAVEGTAPPACPISSIPQEILADILLKTALADVSSFVRLAQVCRRLAYLVGTEERIWKRVCQGPEWGFGGMHYKFACTLEGKKLLRPLDGDHEIENKSDRGGEEIDLETDISSLTLSPDLFQAPKKKPPIPPCVLPVLPLTAPYTSYLHMHHVRPRIRFTGLYISTVNYVRPGASSPTQITWTSPVHIVTYYRYLRFYRNGSCLSLLTTVEPAEVVPHLREENAPRGGKPSIAASELALGGAGLQAVAKQCLRGRWRLSGRVAAAPASEKSSNSSGAASLEPANAPLSPPLPSSSSSTKAVTEQSSKNAAAVSSQPCPSEPEGIITIETTGPTPAYTYTMRLRLESVRTSSSKNTNSNPTPNQGYARNNRLAWAGFWSYNRLTDDWAEFMLKNDRAFLWSRVRSWADS